MVALTKKNSRVCRTCDNSTKSYATKFCSECITKRREKQAQKHRLVPKRLLPQFLGTTSGLCSICQKKLTVDTVRVDHDHDTGRIRGPLCNGCNLGLGHFIDNPEWLMRAAEYLKRHAEYTKRFVHHTGGVI